MARVFLAWLFLAATAFAQVQSLDTVTSLFKAAAIDGARVRTLGYNAPGDGGANTYYYDASSTATIDGGHVMPGRGGSLSFSGTTFDGTAGTGRFLAVDPSKFNPLLFGAGVGDATDDTSAIQRCVNTADDNATIEFPKGYLLTTGVTVPANKQLFLKGANSSLRANTGATTVLTFTGDTSRLGRTRVEGIVIDGQSIANVVGIKIGTATDPMLYVHVTDCYVKDCYVGYDIFRTQELTMTACTAFSNTIGMRIQQSTAGGEGGGNANAFYNCAFQTNTIGLFVDGVSTLPMHNNVFSGGIFQSNSLCAIAMYDHNGCTFDGLHYEGNGTAGTTLAVDTRTVTRSCFDFDNSVVSVSNTEMSHGDTPLFRLRNGCRLTLKDVTGYGDTDGVYVDGTLSDHVSFLGTSTLNGYVRANVVKWPDYVDTPVRFAGIGDSTTTITNEVENLYTLDSVFAPIFSNGVGTSGLSLTFDSTLKSQARSITFGASAGSISSNRITMQAFPGNVAQNDTWVVCFHAKANQATNIHFAASGGLADFNCPLDTEWRRVTLVIKAAVANADQNLYMFPDSDDAPTLSVANIQVTKVPTGGDVQTIAKVVKNQLFNIRRSSLAYNNNSPGSGTWLKGDVVRNRSPDPGDPYGWVCVVAGTPGEWVAIDDNGTIDVRDFGATGDNSTNDTTAIQAALDAVPAGGGTVIFGPGTYLCDRIDVSVAGTIVQGQGATIRANGGTALRVEATDVTIENLVVDGDLSAGTGIDVLDGSDRVRIRFCEIFDVQETGTTADGIFVGDCQDVDISHNHIHDISVTDLNAVRAIRFSSGDAGAFVSGTCSHNRIDHVYPRQDGDGIVMQGYDTKSQLVIANNVFTRVAKSAIKIQSDGAVITGNQITMTNVGGGLDPQAAIRTQSDDIVISNNSLTVTAVESAIIAYGTGVTISGNVVNFVSTGSGCNGFLASSDLTHFSITGNTFRGGFDKGLQFEGNTSHGSITGNIFDNFSDHAIQFDGTVAEDLSILGNVITGMTTGSSNVIRYTGGGTPARIIADTVYDGSGTSTLYRNGALAIRQANPLTVIYGTGSPEGVVSGDVGHRYIRTDGGAGTVTYVKESGTGTNTGWVAK